MKRNLTIHRLTRLANYIDNLDKTQFYFGAFIEKFDENNSCGTMCCAAGWLPILYPNAFKWQYNKLSGTTFLGFNPAENEWFLVLYTPLVKFFGISVELTEHLFYPGRQTLAWTKDNQNFSAKITNKEWAEECRRIIEMIKKGKLDGELIEPYTSEQYKRSKKYK